jgi:hypothetical protein
MHRWFFGAGMLALVACARNPVSTIPAAPLQLILGDFVDDYGGRFTVTRDDWFQRPRSHYRIVAWHPGAQYLIAQNDSANRTAPGRWTRIDWVALPDQQPFQWGFCFSAFDAPTREAAEATQVVDRRHPETGCNGYPFSRMRPSAPPPD